MWVKMGLLAIIVVLYIIGFLIESFKEKKDDFSSPSSKDQINRQKEANRREELRRKLTEEARREEQNALEELRRKVEARRKEETTYRPTSRKPANKGIVFNTAPSDSSSTTTLTQTLDLSGLNDAFTGAALDKKLGLYQCQSCKVYYHSESFEILRAENSSKCVACTSTNIIDILGSTNNKRGKNYTPDVVTLENYKQHVGSVVTFEGYVCKVNESRRGNDFAVMFENESWTEGFKLVFFRGAAVRIGGASYIKSLSNKKIKVRGLLIKHPKFGYEIIISQKSMILSVSK